MYVKEAHPEDGWQVPDNEKDGVCYLQPRTLADRVAIVNDFVKRFTFTVPILVDPMDNPAMDAYTAWPERLYVIGADGRLLYVGAPGPRGVDPEELAGVLAGVPPL